MNINRLILKFSAIFLLLLIVVSSCTKDDQGPDYSYFVSKELSVSYDKEYIDGLLDVVSSSIPEVSSLKSFVESDIDIL